MGVRTGPPQSRLSDAEFRRKFEAYFGEQLLDFLTNPGNYRLLQFSPEETMLRFTRDRKVWLKNDLEFITKIGQDFRLNWLEIHELHNNWRY